MATVTTTITPAAAPFPYSGPRQVDSFVPAGEWRVSDRTTAAATAAGDNQYVECTITLPENRAFLLMDFFVSVGGNNAAATNNIANQIFADWQNAASDPTVEAVLELRSQGSSPTGNVNYDFKSYHCPRMPLMVMLPKGAGEAVVLRYNFYNETANDIAYTIRTAARFLEYSLTQAFDFRINANLPVR